MATVKTISQIAQTPRERRTPQEAERYRQYLREKKARQRTAKKGLLPAGRLEAAPVSALRPLDGKSASLVGILREYGVLGTLQAIESALLTLIQTEPSAAKRTKLLEDASKLSRLVASFSERAA